jgi:hypothetical protein
MNAKKTAKGAELFLSVLIESDFTISNPFEVDLDIRGDELTQQYQTTGCWNSWRTRRMSWEQLGIGIVRQRGADDPIRGSDTPRGKAIKAAKNLARNTEDMLMALRHSGFKVTTFTNAGIAMTPRTVSQNGHDVDWAVIAAAVEKAKGRSPSF